MLSLFFAVVLSITELGDWGVRFTPHNLNVEVDIFTECRLNGKVVYVAPSSAPIGPGDDFVAIHRDKAVPKSASCKASVDVYRNPDGQRGDPEKDYAAEGAVITWIEP